MIENVMMIFNPLANLGRAWPIAASLRPLVERFWGADWSGTVYPKHATEVAYRAARQGYDLVVALGGDGTVHEVINGLMQVPAERRPRLGIVPIGTGNDFAHSLGISADTQTALQQVLDGSPQAVDVGLIEENSGRREYWMNSLGIGFDAIGTIRSRRIPILKGFLLYLLAALQTMILDYQTFGLTLQVDGRLIHERALMLILCNGRREGGGFHIAPQAELNDQRMHYVGVRTISRARMFQTLPYFLRGQQTRLPHVFHGDFRAIHIQSDRPMVYHADGEILANLRSDVTGLKVSILPSAVQVMC